MYVDMTCMLHNCLPRLQMEFGTNLKINIKKNAKSIKMKIWTKMKKNTYIKDSYPLL